MVLTGFVKWRTLILMFERFTNRARHVVVLSQEEARKLQHNYIGTEHILLGLLGEPDGIAGRALAQFGMSLEGARDEVKAVVGIGRAKPSGHIPFTPRAKKTLELALREALGLSHNYIGTEHILLGIMREGDGVGAKVIEQHGDPAAVRAAVLDTLAATRVAGETSRSWLRRQSGESRSAVEQVLLSATPAGDKALSEAARLAGALPVGSHHLLLAALADPDTAAARALAGLGVDLDRAKAALRTADVTWYQRRAAGRGGPAPAGHPGDGRASHAGGDRSRHHQGGPGRAAGAGRPGRPARHHPRRPGGVGRPQCRLAGTADRSPGCSAGGDARPGGVSQRGGLAQPGKPGSEAA